MKHRITYIRPNDVPFDPKQQISVGEKSMELRSLRASKEYRLTIGLDELPAEIVRVLEQCHELRARWLSPLDPYPARGPFASRLPPGLHVFATPRTKDGEMGLICPMITKPFGEDIKCATFYDTFTVPAVLSERFATSASAQFFSDLSSLGNFALYLQHEICSPANALCQESAFSLLMANYLDIDFDAISHVLNIVAYWDAGPSEEGWQEIISKTNNDRIEVGILNEEKPDEREEIKLGGWLTVLGQDTKPSTVLFGFPSRHHSLPNATFFATFDYPTGLHPTLRLTFPSPFPGPPSDSCALHSYLTLPSHLFLDPYPFTDPLLLQSHNLSALHSHSGARDLEAPDWAISQWGSAALFALSTPPPSTQRHTATVPLHLRYLSPNPGGHRRALLPAPAVFYACPSEAAQDAPPFSTNPFDRTDLGFDGLFGPRSVFYHLQPLPPPAHGEGIPLMAEVQVPVLDAEWAAWIRQGTVGVVLLGFAAVVWALLKPLGGAGSTGSGKGKRKGKKE